MVKIDCCNPISVSVCQYTSGEETRGGKDKREGQGKGIGNEGAGIKYFSSFHPPNTANPALWVNVLATR